MAARPGRAVPASAGAAREPAAGRRAALAVPQPAGRAGAALAPLRRAQERQERRRQPRRADTTRR